MLHSIIIIWIMILYLLLDTLVSRAHTLMSGQRKIWQTNDCCSSKILHNDTILFCSPSAICIGVQNTGENADSSISASDMWETLMLCNCVGRNAYILVRNRYYVRLFVDWIGHYDSGLTVRELVSKHAHNELIIFRTHQLLHWTVIGLIISCSR